MAVQVEEPQADAWRARWSELSGTEPPTWLRAIALADGEMTSELVSLVAAAAGVEMTPDAAASLIQVLGGVELVPLHAAVRLAGLAAVPPLRPSIRESMLAELAEVAGGPGRARSELIQAGLTIGDDRLAVQLAIWAHGAHDWSALETLWLATDPALFLTSARARQVFTDVPREQRQRHPGLSFARAIFRSHDLGTNDFDIDLLVRVLLEEGRELHARWFRHTGIDSAVLAGTLWMVAQASNIGSVDDRGLSASWETHLAVEELIADRTKLGDPPSNRSLVAFHAISTATTILRSDWRRTSLHAELGMTMAAEGDIFGRFAQAAFAMISLVNGSPTGVQRGLSGEDEAGSRSSSTTEMLMLGELLGAISKLDRGKVEAILNGTDHMSSWLRWFNFEPMFIWIRAQAAILWADPERALAEFDASFSDHASYGLDAHWGPALQRMRAELLLNLGAVNRAEGIIAGLLSSGDRIQGLVPAARLQLTVGNHEQAIALADEGIHSLRVVLPDRAQLHVIKAAAMQLCGADKATARRQATSACLLCLDSGTALPFALLPVFARRALLENHSGHSDGTPCLLIDVAASGGFDSLRQSDDCRKDLIRLTPREKVLLPLLATPATFREIADRLFVSVNTVQKQVVTLRQKLGACNRTELIRLAHELGLAEASEPQ